MNEPSETITIVWRGITINATYRPKYFANSAHVELRVPGKEKIPVTDTGYRSHFHPQGEVEEAGGIETYVRDWLDRAAQSPSWKALEEQARQPDLFG